MATTSNSSKQKRKLWTEESMEAAVNSIRHENKGLREAARLYNIPVETLRRRTDGRVEAGCRPGPSTILTDEEEDKLASYLVQMADMGFGLSRDTVMEMAFTIVEKSQRRHPFRDGKAGRAWFEGFRRRHPKLFAPHSHFHTAEHFAPIKRPLMSFLENLGQCMDDST